MSDENVARVCAGMFDLVDARIGYEDYVWKHSYDVGEYTFCIEMPEGAIADNVSKSEAADLIVRWRGWTREQAVSYLDDMIKHDVME